MTSSSHIYFVLDRSGSMCDFVDDTIGGFKTFVKGQQTDNPNGVMSLFLFNDKLTPVYKNKPIKEVEMLDSSKYSPCGTTALCDAIGSTIKFADSDDHHQTIIVILTDGEDNTSTKYTRHHINDLIDMKKKNGWQFVFLAANQDAIKVANQYGICQDSALTFNQGHTEDTFECLSAAVGRQVTGESQNVEFTGLERMKSCPRPEYASMATVSSEVFTGVVHDSVSGLQRH